MKIWRSSIWTENRISGGPIRSIEVDALAVGPLFVESRTPESFSMFSFESELNLILEAEGVGIPILWVGGWLAGWLAGWLIAVRNRNYI